MNDTNKNTLHNQIAINKADKHTVTDTVNILGKDKTVSLNCGNHRGKFVDNEIYYTKNTDVY